MSITTTPVRPDLRQALERRVCRGAAKRRLSVWRGVSGKAVTLSLRRTAAPYALVLHDAFESGGCCVEPYYVQASLVKSKQFHEANEPHHLQPLFRYR